MTTKYHNTKEDLDYIFIYLSTMNYFTEGELLLVIRAWGDNIDTYDTICQVRFGMDFEQLEDEDMKMLNEANEQAEQTQYPAERY